jgi:hypothetical protein
LAGVACVEQDANVLEREAGAFGHVDDAESGERVLCVAALTAYAWCIGQQALFLVVADGGEVEAGALGHLADRECAVVHAGA